MFKRKGGGSKAFWTMLKKNCTFLTRWLPLCRELIPFSNLLLAFDFFYSFLFSFFFFYIYYNPWGARKGTFLRILVSFQSGTEKYRLIILLYLHLLSCSSTLDLLFFSGSGASTLARELEPPRPWLDVGVNCGARPRVRLSLVLSIGP